MNQLLSLVIFGLLSPWSNGFQSVQVQRNAFISQASSSSVLFHNQQPRPKSSGVSSRFNCVSTLFPRPQFDAISASGVKNVQMAGTGGIPMFGLKSFLKDMVRFAKAIIALPGKLQTMTKDDIKPYEWLKKLHGPKTYMLMSLVLAKKFAPKMFNNQLFWLWMAFNVKWYRARYVYKVPVWDRQPGWNNVITSKEQEKDLKAFTCKTCGSTIFIAKSREFFFEGDTGIGGLGCFSCGAKGKDNFVMDRDRIVEDVGDDDDYFDYERPLDFVSAAERRALLKETKGDEEAANKLLVERDGAQASEESQSAADAVVNGSTGTMDDSKDEEPKISEEVEETPEVIPSPKAKKVSKSTQSGSSGDEDDIDILDMDDL
jgi:hypothetical protein